VKNASLIGDAVLGITGRPGKARDEPLFTGWRAINASIAP
jgi:hypothetical protein